MHACHMHSCLIAGEMGTRLLSSIADVTGILLPPAKVITDMDTVAMRSFVTVYLLTELLAYYKHEYFSKRS